MEDEQVEQFQSDFRIVADYFVQMRKNKNYQPSAATIRHVDEMLKLMSVLTQDIRFEQVYQESGGTVDNMCEVLDRIEARGREEDREEGRNEIIKLMSEGGMSNVQIGNMLKMPISIIVEI